MTTRPPLPDHASDLDARGIELSRVGIRGLRYPITVLDRDHGTQATLGSFDSYVRLPAERRGTHMSRFVEALEAHGAELSAPTLPRLLSELQRRLEVDEVHLAVTFPFFVRKRAPISSVESALAYDCAFRTALRGKESDVAVAVRVPVTTVCPCSKAISDRGAHNQRSLVEVELRSEKLIWFEELIALVEACASSPVWALLKREDEKYVTERAYDHPVFVEDLVREILGRLQTMAGIRTARVSAENHESIHDHAAFAEASWTSPA